jgi:hypothetical protein
MEPGVLKNEKGYLGWKFKSARGGHINSLIKTHSKI